MTYVPLRATYNKYVENDVIIEKWTFMDDINQQRQLKLLELGGRGLISSHLDEGRYVVTRRRRKPTTGGLI